MRAGLCRAAPDLSRPYMRENARNAGTCRILLEDAGLTTIGHSLRSYAETRYASRVFALRRGVWTRSTAHRIVAVFHENIEAVRPSGNSGRRLSLVTQFPFLEIGRRQDFSGERGCQCNRPARCEWRFRATAIFSFSQVLSRMTHALLE